MANQVGLGKHIGNWVGNTEAVAKARAARKAAARKAAAVWVVWSKVCGYLVTIGLLYYGGTLLVQWAEVQAAIQLERNTAACAEVGEEYQLESRWNAAANKCQLRIETASGTAFWIDSKAFRKLLVQ